ncbi:CtsR family transcriptional regulator [Desulfosporosinus sp.]|uniref:CtsR family transcriptional regulator n=1 Tax=Desulfosporosinus sp. TaxID=157907 RepID=UPI000E9E3469|nr:CtsR family transcriptional regulator [Desulfosporosinus sp.]MBC2723098.1 CtsR family transcriptional regulator [Desulfosporosinus sp.]MBC2728754.1 CtsR family transcriptional regulator [Desulfosporosinus sp.]HBV87680.1 transcriptional regulator [Desulfosporosinus sp.]
MGNLADRIEEYLKQILEKTSEGYIVLQRSELAGEFACVPSQINYVLDTRFTVERGYLVESRRGGGGYLRIIRLGLGIEGQYQQVMRQLVGEQLSRDRSNALVERLLDEELITPREAALIKSVLSGNNLGGEFRDWDALRARLMKDILTTLSRDDLV